MCDRVTSTITHLSYTLYERNIAMDTFYHAVQLPLFVTSKVCPDCGKEKPLEAFHKHKSKPDRHAVYCKACKKKQDALYGSTHTEQKKAYNAAYKAKNSEQISVLGQVRYLKNREQKIAYEYKRYWANREQKIAYVHEWSRSNPLKQREIKKRRRARKKGVTTTRVSYKRILERDGYWCYI